MSTLGKFQPSGDGLTVMATRSISLPDALAAQIDRRVSEGKYRDADEVVNVALQFLFDRESHSEFLKGEIEVGTNQFASGDYRTLTMDLLKEIKEEGRTRKAAIKKES